MGKADLIKAHQQGQLKDSAVCGLSNTSSVVIVEIDNYEEKVFGYITGGSQRDYFYVKFRQIEDDGVFKVGRLNFRFSQFMRVTRQMT